MVLLCCPIWGHELGSWRSVPLSVTLYGSCFSTHPSGRLFLPPTPTPSCWDDWCYKWTTSQRPAPHVLGPGNDKVNWVAEILFQVLVWAAYVSTRWKESIVFMRQKKRVPRECTSCTKSVPRPNLWPSTQGSRHHVIYCTAQTESQLIIPCWSLQPDVLWPSLALLSVLCPHPSQGCGGQNPAFNPEDLDFNPVFAAS